MKIHALILALGGVFGAAAVAQAQTPPGPPDPLSDAQAAFGKIVGDAFHAPDPVVVSTNPPGSPGSALGTALRTSIEAPGAVFAGVMQPFAAADAAASPAPAPASAAAPHHHRHARLHHHRSPAMG